MLLTSGQISMTISSCIVLIFTSLLFLSGYVLQQQTVRSLQAAIRPPPPTPSPALTQIPPSSTKAKAFGDSRGSQSHVSYQQHLQGEPSLDWTKLAYVQLLKSHEDVCNALMLFAELVEQDSPAQRLILYPKVWDDESDRVTRVKPSIKRSTRLLQIAAQRYNVSLFPVEPLVDTSYIELAYPTTGLLSLTKFQRLLLLNPSGLLLHGPAMDTLLSIPTASPISYFPDKSRNLTVGASIGMIIQPSMQTFRDTMDISNDTSPGQDATLLKVSGIHSSHEIDPYMISQTADLGLQDNALNATMYNKRTAYVQLVDRNMAGPQYDIPRDIILQSRPAELEARKIWEDLYEIYRIKRMNICGLDLEPLPNTNLKSLKNVN